MNVNQAEWSRTAREVPKFAFVEDVSDSTYRVRESSREMGH